MENRPILVLAIDDSRSALRVLEATAKIAGFEFHGTTSAQKGLELAIEIEPDVVLSDIIMPEMDGFELCKTLKKNRHTQLIPVILITSLDARDDRVRGIEVGCDDFITKPVDRLTLTARIRSLARMRRLTQTLDDAEKVLESLARSVEAKDGTTGAHCDRLIREGKAFGTFLGLSRLEIRALSRAGVLHDIGKIGIPDSVLMKPGKLDSGEWEIMKRHPVIGAELLAPLSTMVRVVPIVRSHHERWDGGGYPDGLKGNDIPFLARCFQLLDAFDALTTERPYKRAFSIDETCDILKRECSEGRWDPDLLPQFLTFLEQNSPEN
ncbi:MAG TPA: response regulator [Myxococcales bacterium]|nr:response regulator [Myxococcales bacterium]HIN86965.1 response regulator [Myxococcales bacterium]